MTQINTDSHRLGKHRAHNLLEFKMQIRVEGKTNRPLFLLIS